MSKAVLTNVEHCRRTTNTTCVWQGSHSLASMTFSITHISAEASEVFADKLRALGISFTCCGANIDWTQSGCLSNTNEWVAAYTTSRFSPDKTSQGASRSFCIPQPIDIARQSCHRVVPETKDRTGCYDTLEAAAITLHDFLSICQPKAGVGNGSHIWSAFTTILVGHCFCNNVLAYPSLPLTLFMPCHLGSGADSI